MRVLILLLALFATGPVWAAPPIILAAASLQEALEAAADAWAAQGHERPRIAFAGTPALARQIEAGSPADLFLSADEAWGDTLQAKGLLRPDSRVVLLSNRLVLVVPASDRRPIRRLRELPDRIGRQRLALADPAAVPAGRYAKAALERSGVWPRIEPRVASAENVRAALLQVARGTAAAGIVYATDARVEPGVRVAGVVPRALHPPIRYVMAVPSAARNPDGAVFGAWLRSAAGRRFFLRAGFLPPR